MLRTISLVLLGLMVSSCVFAASTGPIVSDRWGKTAFSVEYNEVLDRDLDSSDSNYTGYNIVESDQFYGVFAHRFYDKDGIQANAYFKIGASDFELEGSNVDLFDSSTTETHHFNTSFLWGVCGNIVYPFFKNYQIVLDGQYVTWSPDLEEVVLSATPSSSIDGDVGAYVYELQAALMLRGIFDMGDERNAYTLAPYVGMVLSYIDIDMDDITYNTSTTSGGIVTNLSGDSEDCIGVVLGTEIFLPIDFRIKVDGRVITEEAITLSGILEF